MITTALNDIQNASPAVARQVSQAFSRFLKGDWGDMPDEDKNLNDDALRTGDRIVAKYGTVNGYIYIITEHDRSCTTIMLAEEY